MNRIFADSYYFLAVGSERDQGHKRATDFALSYHGLIVTTEWVFTEIGDALSAPHQRGRFEILLDLVGKDENCVVVEASHDLFERGVSLFSQRPDKSWSLTDCISFIVMQEHGIRGALTADHHFVQAGFEALLLEA